MKSVRTYNMDQDCIRILNSKPNKSGFVNAAVRKVHKKMLDVEPSDFSSRRLAIALKNKEEVPNHIRVLLEEWLYTTS